MDNANTSVRDVGGVKIVDILRDMDFLTAKDIKDGFIRLMQAGHRSIIGNLLAVKLVDSSGLEALATAQIKARSLNVHFSIVLTSPNIRKLLATTGLDGFLEIHQTEADAVNSGKTLSVSLTTDVLQQVPKVLLHDHLDGGLRPATIIELAQEAGYVALPTSDPEELRQWFFRGANRGSLGEYLEGFAHTTAVMQTRPALERIAYEMMDDMQKDGVCYVETRFAPVQHTQRGLHCDEVVTAVLAGLERGRRDFGVRYGVIICAMRNLQQSLEMAELAVDFRDRGVVGFDLAGEEGGYPPKKHVDAFEYILRENFNITLHAGEAFGKESIWQALQWCGAHRIGHATRLIEDMTLVDGRVVKLGRLAQYVLDKRIPLEICLSSNVHTGACPRLSEHPFRVYSNEQFRVTLNTDNRLMSDTTLTREYVLAHEVFGLDLAALEKITINAMKSGFNPYRDRLDLIYEVIKPGFHRVRRDYRM